MLLIDIVLVKVVFIVLYSELVKLFNCSLLVFGVRLVDEDSKELSIQLQVLFECWGDFLIVIDLQGCVQEYSLCYVVIFIFCCEDGSELVLQQVIELLCDYVLLLIDVIGIIIECEILVMELCWEMFVLIICCIDSVVCVEIEKGGSLFVLKVKLIEGVVLVEFVVVVKY